MQSDKECSYEWRRQGEEVLWAIANAAEIAEDAASDVLSVLQDRHFDHEAAIMGEECPFDDDSYYEEKNSGCAAFTELWETFENSLKTQARFISRSAQANLDSIFANLETLVGTGGAPVVVTVGPEKEIESVYRARVFAAEDEKLKEALTSPWKHLGPPPMLAATAGRMNARGISVFYGSIKSDTALAEVRPPVGSKVAIARFKIVRPLKLLDVDALQAVKTTGSIFNPEYIKEIQRANFLPMLRSRITRPVMPNEEAFEYLATQAVADYLATEARLDGVIFPSVQMGEESANVVLFHHSSRVAEVVIPKGTQIQVEFESYDEEGSHPAYGVHEVVPIISIAKETDSDAFDWSKPMPDPATIDTRTITLEINTESVTVHHVTAVSFTADGYVVDRTRTIKPETP